MLSTPPVSPNWTRVFEKHFDRMQSDFLQPPIIKEFYSHLRVLKNHVHSKETASFQTLVFLSARNKKGLIKRDDFFLLPRSE